MNNWLNPDNTFFTIVGKAFDMLVINLLWLFLCLPVVTIIPATTAMYYTVVKVIRRERSYAIKEFFRSFKRNLKQGVLFSILLTAAVFVMYIDFRYALMLMEEGQSTGSSFFGIFLVIALLLSAVFAYISPVLSRFDMKFGGILKTAFFMSTRHILTTLVLLVLGVVVLLGSYVLLPGIFILPVAGTLAASFLIERVFKKYMPSKKEYVEQGTVADAEEREDVSDEWYLE